MNGRAVRRSISRVSATREIRPELDREGIHVYGFRIAEPNHDGTPHWHLLLFVSPPKRDRLREILRRYALAVDGDEPGAAEHRFQVEEIDRRRGTATGYVAKYISKNIDGYGLEDEGDGHDPKSKAERVDAWASRWGIRQFQQIGGPSVTIWRELRRIREPIAGALEMEAARQAADIGDWAAYVKAQGGIDVRRASRPVQLLKVWSDEAGRYGEAKGELINGVSSGIVDVQTRTHRWTIEFVGRPAPASPGEPESCAGGAWHAHRYTAHERPREGTGPT